ncbi:hypothetical protein FRC14_002815 [Serendipita sp. 396]|nr:hypothetical protein FRC14_002815 [Serendipita sp. 396]KAG8782900.1 hypothetical protein FRC15_006094 [Serendipita sp. 397]KAG8826907.1 hypothetical protein FRC19_006780 [Serendipita sp. 401]KAG8866803.1 hypothetical protein FRC20_007511 [Serendipita sp. 405]KAG9057583.1 hypothetical protein FS842_005544 [Serendipita sp. 407]
MQINKLSSSNKIEPMSSTGSYIQDVTDDDEPVLHAVETIAQGSPRGRGNSQKDLSMAVEDPSMIDTYQSLKIKLTVPPGFRRRVVETSSGSPRQGPRSDTAATAIAKVIKRGRPRKYKNTDEADEYAPPRGFKPPKSTVTLSSGPPRLPLNQVYHPSPDQSSQSRFPTFVPASVLSSDDLTDSEDSDLSDPDDLIARDKPHPPNRTRTHRELLKDDDGQVPTRTPWKHNRHANSNRHTPILNSHSDKKSVQSSSGNEEDDEDSSEATEDEADPDQRPQSRSFFDDEDENLDASLFFRNLIEESSGSEDEAQTDGDSIMGDILQTGAELSDTDTDVETDQIGQELMVKEGWDGQLVFSTDILPPAGPFDIDFELTSSQLDEASQPNSLANSLSTLPVTQPGSLSDDEFEEMDSATGDTTDDEIMPSTLPATVTVTPGDVFIPATPATPFNQTSMLPPPSPADVLARTSFHWDIMASPVPSIATTDDIPPRSRSVSVHSLGSRGPRLGFFNGSRFGSKKTIIGDTGGKLPSPFSVLTPAAPVMRRKRRANSDLGSFFNKRTRNTHSLNSSYFSDDLFSAPQGDFVDLDDLLDASLLSEDIDKTATATGPILDDLSTSRWDRIPMGIYRQTRDIPSSHTPSVSFSFAIGGFGSQPPLPRPDFASPARSHVSHGSIDSILWDDEILAPRRTSNHTHNKKRPRDLSFEGETSRMGSSRGDRTPTQTRTSMVELSSDFIPETKSRKEKRKEKKREKASLQKQILSALDETFDDGYDDLMAIEE